MTYATSSSSSNNTFIDDYLMQQQQQQQQSRQNVQHPMLFNRSVLKNEGGTFVFL
jgi:hypothetical protein